MAKSWAAGWQGTFPYSPGSQDASRPIGHPPGHASASQTVPLMLALTGAPINSFFPSNFEPAKAMTVII
jgi:hypothetical protein